MLLPGILLISPYPKLTPITLSVITHSVIGSFQNIGAENIFDGRSTRAARRVCPQNLWSIAHRKLDQINRVRVLQDLAVPPGNRLERLKGDRSGQHSIRINDQYRICFRWEAEYAHEVEITDDH